MTLTLGLALETVSSFCDCIYIQNLRQKEIVALAVVRDSSGYFPVLECISYSIACRKDFVFLARVRVSSQYFPVLDCISYSCAKRDRGSR